MNRSRLSFLLLSLIVLVPIVTGTLMARSDAEGEDSLFKYLSVFQDVLRLIRQAYVEEVSVETLIEGAIEGASDALDPFSTFVPAEHVDGFRQVLEVGSRRSGLTMAKERGIAFVVSVAEGSPAAVAGLQRQDVVTSIAGESTRQLPLWRIWQNLTAEPGTRIDMEILREGAPTTAELVLEDWQPQPVDVQRQDGVAVLRLLWIDEATVAGVRRVLEELETAGETRLLIDLREAVSDTPEDGYALGALFASGSLGVLTQGETEIESFSSEEEPAWEGDVVVLVGRGSIGGAEILASVLRDAARARLVGQTSFGHAGRLSLLPLSTGAHMLLTDAFYAGPDGEPIRQGLTPDVEVTERNRRFADKDVTLEDLTLRRGLELLESGTVEDLEDVA